eukprot:11102466-Ditylum_brightwellii.AAC.1
MEAALELSREANILFGNEPIGLQGQEARLQQIMTSCSELFQTLVPELYTTPKRDTPHILEVTKPTLSLRCTHRDALVKDKKLRTSPQI